MGVTTSSTVAATYEPIATTTLGSATLSYTFNSIPGTYTDLILIYQGGSGDVFSLQFNSDTGSNYSYTRLLGNGSSASSSRENDISIAKLGGVPSTQNIVIAHIQNYANTSTYKTVISRGNAPENNVTSYVSLWRNTNAITSIKCQNDSATNLPAGLVLTLYGIKAA